jgi:hypothetical protein
MSVDFLGDERWRATAVRCAHDSLVAKVEQMQRALGLSQDPKTILDEIKKTLHADVRKQVGTFVWIETEGPAQAKPGGVTVLQALYEREGPAAFNQTDDEPPEYFVDAIQDFKITREGKTPTREVRKTARNAWRDDPGANRRIHESKPASQRKGFRSPYRGRPEKYDSDVVLAFAHAIARITGQPWISWTRGTGTPDHRGIPNHGSRGVVLDVLVAAVEWAMSVAWQSGPSGSTPPTVKAEGILRILKKARRSLTNSTD